MSKRERKTARSPKPAKPPMRQSEAVLSHLGPTNSHTLGSNRNHDHPTIPSSTFRTLEQAISRNQLRTHEVYKGYNPRTGKSKYVDEPDDLLAHAQASITKGRFRPVTDGFRQRYQKQESVMSGVDPRQADCYPCSPTPLGGMMGGARGRKDRY